MSSTTVFGQGTGDNAFDPVESLNYEQHLAGAARRVEAALQGTTKTTDSDGNASNAGNTHAETTEAPENASITSDNGTAGTKSAYNAPETAASPKHGSAYGGSYGGAPRHDAL